MGCDGCPLRGQKIIKAQGPRKAQLMFVGEAPHTHEMEEERPFADTGKSGELLQHLLHYLGLSRERVVLANAIRCKIDKNDTKAVNAALKHCKEHLYRAILQVKPRLIVIMGDYALRQVLKLQKITQQRGRFFDLPYAKLQEGEEGSTRVFVTVHPAYVLRQSQRGYPLIPYEQMNFKEKLLINDFRTVKKYIENAFKETPIDTSGYVDEVVGFDGKVASFDIELTGREYRRPEVEMLCIGMSDTPGSAQISLSEKVPKSIRKVLEDPKITKVVAARPFDENVLFYKHGITVKGPIIDVLSLAHCLDENYVHNLENVANHYTDLKNIKDLSEGLRSNMSEMDTDTLTAYNGVDVDATLRSFLAMRKAISTKPGVLNYYKNFVMPIQNMFVQTSRVGMHIDRKALRKSEEEVSNIMEDAYADAIAEVPEVIVKKHEDGKSLLNKNAFVADYLFRHRRGLRIKPLMVTPKTKAPTLKASHLAMLDPNPFITNFLDYKQASKILNTYFERLRACIYPDGKIYPDTIIRTVTGRTVMHSPEIQTYPKRGRFAPYIRRAIIPPKGWTLCARDLSQSELRIIGWMAQDPGILGALRAGVDLHTKTAKDVLKKREINDDDRRAAKAVNFGFVYGMQANGFRTYARESYNVIVSLEEAQTFREEFFNTYPRLPVYHNTMIEFAQDHGFVVSPLGRRRHLPNILSPNWEDRSEAERQAINSPVQSFSSDLGLLGMCLAQRRGLDFLVPVWFIHDEIIFLAKKGKEREAHLIMKECMEQETVTYIKEHFGITVGYPIESDGKMGKNWAEMEKVPW